MSPYEPLDNSSLHMAFKPCRRCCAEQFVANVYGLQANSLVLERLAGLFHGGLVGGNCESGILRNLWPVYPSLPKWSIVIAG